MTTLNLTSKIELEQVIQILGQLSNAELEKVLSRLSILLARRKTPNLPASEVELLRKINQGCSEQRHAILTRRLQTNTLTKAEHQELMTIINQIEPADAERMQALITLSNLRAIPVETLMQRLEIHSPAYCFFAILGHLSERDESFHDNSLSVDTPAGVQLELWMGCLIRSAATL